jgi:hypothetical protein
MRERLSSARRADAYTGFMMVPDWYTNCCNCCT